MKYKLLFVIVLMLFVGLMGAYFVYQATPKALLPPNYDMALVHRVSIPAPSTLPLDTKQVVLAQLLALQNRDYNDAYRYVSDAFKRTASLREFEHFVQYHDALIQHETFTLIAGDEDVVNDDTEGLLSNKISKPFVEQHKEKSLADSRYSMIRGLLTDPSGKQARVTFSLINQAGEWRIDNIDVEPLVAKSANSISKLVFAMQKMKKLDLSKTFDNMTSFYEMNYPNDWTYEKINQGAVVFTGKPGSRSFFSTINVQTILTKKSGGNFATLPELVASIKNKVEESSNDVHFLKEGPMDLPARDGGLLEGYFVEMTYTYSGREYQQWQVVVKRGDDRAFYTWAFTSPKRTFMYDLPTAQAIFKTWKIY